MVGEDGGKGEEALGEVVELVSSNQSVGNQIILVGKIMARKILNKIVVKEVITKSWNAMEEIIIAESNPNMYIFTVHN